MLSKVPKALADKIINYAKLPQTGVSLRQMVEFGHKPNQGSLLWGSKFIHNELPIRLSHRVVELDTIPELNDLPAIQRVKNWYIESFNELVHFPPVPDKLKNLLLSNTLVNGENELESEKDLNFDNPVRYYYNTRDIDYPLEVQEYNASFTKLIGLIKKRHDAVVTTIAQGIKDYKRCGNIDVINDRSQKFLDRFYLSRIGIRVLIGQHLELNNPGPNPDFSGIICTRTKIADVIKMAIDNAKQICLDSYILFSPPEIEVYCPPNLEFMYIPSHLHHMVFELVKNSLRATVEAYGEDEENFPPVKVIVAKGNEDITIKISDEGGGIPRSSISKIWTYTYTTADTPDLEDTFNQSDFKAPMAGLGYGLPLSRLYARYFGGDIKLISMENFGTDAYLHLSRLSNSNEPLS
ncbi:hypothetical protein BB560_001689 [Smittium megazygosporum]|uniref:Protein-serine/threonine kinase n=1 Tax=Smittium megazygosporum TaxID=133381 RepID=A0A2T9ZGU3_9FUNG|nr:hypothetical protein BB560_001689 [Smittium megazygosporum]